MKDLARVLLFVVGAGSALAAGAGCRPDFAPFNRLTDLRVLAIQSEPAAPASGETATFTALVFTPPGFTEPTYAWTWCPFPAPAAQGYRCLITEEEIARMFPAQAAQLPRFDLGTAPTATLLNAIDPAFLGALCGGMPGAPPITNCDNGFPFQVALTVTSEDESGKTSRVDTVVTGHWRFDPATPPNANPTIERLTINPGPNPDDSAGEEITDLTPPGTPLPRDKATVLHAIVNPSVVESYPGLSDDGVDTTLRERLFMTWFVETGGTDDSRTSFTPPQPPDTAEETRRFRDLQRNTWTPETSKDYPAGTARLYVVIHDNRGGVNWKSGIVNLESTP